MSHNQRLEAREARNKARREATKAIDEEALGLVLKAAGAHKVAPEASRALKAVLEESIAEFAERAAQIAQERQTEVLDADTIAIAAVRINPARQFE